MQNKILVIYVKKENQEYDHYEVYPLSEKLTKEALIEKSNEYNADSSKNLIAKIYDDPVLINFVSDAQASWQNKHVIENLKSISRDIEDSIDNLQSWQDEVENLLEKADEQEKE